MRKQTDTAFASHLDGAITQKESLVVAPGSFDPITLGHLDVIQRAAKLFDEVIVAVAVNSAKRTLLPLETRVALVQSCVENLPSVSVRGVQGLLAEFCRQVGARAIVKGLRGGQDWGHEEPMALVNKELTGIETVFLPAAPTWG
ncbi:MAG: pantetheine-phosphate adenylyltransferase, partial [Bifidobacteriaceae bacterium]|nr:pantetheine-phosphate adenylyltransferase [Bifidobacteriaceae bacterium]